jgi:hypothetical protein
MPSEYGLIAGRFTASILLALVGFGESERRWPRPDEVDAAVPKPDEP